MAFVCTDLVLCADVEQARFVLPGRATADGRLFGASDFEQNAPGTPTRDKRSCPARSAASLNQKFEQRKVAHPARFTRRVAHTTTKRPHISSIDRCARHPAYAWLKVAGTREEGTVSRKLCLKRTADITQLRYLIFEPKRQVSARDDPHGGDAR